MVNLDGYVSRNGAQQIQASCPGISTERGRAGRTSRRRICPGLEVFDAGYDLTRLSWLLKDIPAEVTGRLRGDRVMYFPAPERQAGANGRPPRRGAPLRLADPRT